MPLKPSIIYASRDTAYTNFVAAYADSMPSMFPRIGVLYSGSRREKLQSLIWWITTEKRLTYMVMKNPPHPGKHVRLNCLNPNGLTVTAAALALGVTRQALNNLVNEKAGISPEMAVRLEKMGWGTADGWMRLQMNYELARVRRTADLIKVHPLSSTA